MDQPLHHSSDFPEFDTYPASPARARHLEPASGYTAGRESGHERGFLGRTLVRLPRPSADAMRYRLTRLRNRAAGGATGLKDSAQQGFRQVQHRAVEGVDMVRDRGRFYAREYPLHTLAAIGGTAFLLGAIIRIGRSGHASREW